MTRGVVMVFAMLVICILVFRVWGKRRGPEHVFACASGASVSATFSHESVQLRLPSGTATLPIAMSASGARYANDTLEFWEHAGEARVAHGRTTVFDHCRAQ